MKSQAPAFFIVPGFKQKATNSNFSWLASHLKKARFKVILVPIKWDYRVMSDYISDFERYYEKHKLAVNYVLGFSYGAVITLSSANELNPNKIFLCSLSPDFKEDIPFMKFWIRRLVGKKRLQDASSRSARKIAQELRTPSTIFYGEKEGRKYPRLKMRCEQTAKVAKKSNLIVIRNSPHQIDYPEYQEAVIKEIRLLSEAG